MKTLRPAFEAGMEWIAHPKRFGWILFLFLLSAGAYGAVSQLFLWPQPNGDGVAPPLTPIFLGSLVALVFVFFRAGRSSEGGRPTMSQLAISYLVVLSLVAVTLRGIDQAPYLPDVPGVLLHAVRTALYASAVPAAWTFLFGRWRGWNRRRVDPGPVRRIYGKVPPAIKGEDDDA